MQIVLRGLRVKRLVSTTVSRQTVSRRPYSENCPPRSNYSSPQRLSDLPSSDARDPRMAALNQESYVDLMAPVAEAKHIHLPVTTLKTQTVSIQPRNALNT